MYKLVKLTYPTNLRVANTYSCEMGWLYSSHSEMEYYYNSLFQVATPQTNQDAVGENEP